MEEKDKEFHCIVHEAASVAQDIVLSLENMLGAINAVGLKQQINRDDSEPDMQPSLAKVHAAIVAAQQEIIKEAQALALQHREFDQKLANKMMESMEGVLKKRHMRFGGSS